MATVKDFIRALDSIEAEIRNIPDIVFIEMSLTRGAMNGNIEDRIFKTGRYIMLLASRSILANWDDLCFDIGGPEFPFVWAFKTSQVCDSFPTNLDTELERVEFAVWYYLDSWRNPIPRHLMESYPPDEDDPDPEESLAGMVYQTEMARISNVMSSMKTAWSLAPESVIREFGDITEIPSARRVGGDDNICLWWPAVLLYLALRKTEVVLSAKVDTHIPFETLFDDLPEDGDHQACIDAFVPTTWTISLNPVGLMAATSCALRTFRKFAEDSIEDPDDKPKFEWSPAMLEGLVIALLKEVEYPTQRAAVAWIAEKTGRPAPSTSTLQKTFSWQNRPKKTSKARMTNEAQSGMSIALSAEACLSHEDVADAVIDIQEEIHRQLSSDEQIAVEWTLQQAGPSEEDRNKAIKELVAGFRSA
jgi:hypothetical protein